MRIAQENVLQSGILGQMEGEVGVPLRPTEPCVGRGDGKSWLGLDHGNKSLNCNG